MVKFALVKFASCLTKPLNFADRLTLLAGLLTCCNTQSPCTYGSCASSCTLYPDRHFSESWFNILLTCFFVFFRLFLENAKSMRLQLIVEILSYMKAESVNRIK